MAKQVKDLVETTDLISGTTTLWGMPVCDNLDKLTANVAMVGVPWDLSEPFNRANTRRTPKAAMRIPTIANPPIFSPKNNHPRSAIKIGMVATIQAVVDAWEVTKPVDCSH